jgi:molecular chaperone GrpE
MTQDNQTPQNPDQVEQPAPEQQIDPQVDQTAGDQPQAEVAADEVTQLKNQLEEAQQRILRISADYQNYVRRSQANIESARQHQLMDVAKSLLGVLDHFDRALEVDVEKVTAQSIQQGVQIVRDELLNTLARFDVRVQAIKPGDEFVPGKHEAIMQQDVAGMESGRIGMVFQKGYELGDITLRPAKVSVSK